MTSFSVKSLFGLISIVILFCPLISTGADNAATNSKSGTTSSTSSSGTGTTNTNSGATTTSGSSKSSNILNFDADVIEGERSGPSIMVQMDLQAPNLDTLVFQRKNFNDFHAIDMKRKPKYRGQ